jgi:hypothetical protein
MESKKVFVEFSKNENQNLKEKVLFSLGKETNLQNYLIGESKDSVLTYLEYTESSTIKQDNFNNIAPNSLQNIHEKESAKFITKILACDSKPFSNFDYSSIISNLKEEDLFSLMKEQNLPSISVWKVFTQHDGKTRGGINISFTDQKGKKHSVQSNNFQSDEILLSEMHQKLRECYREFEKTFNNFFPKKHSEMFSPSALDSSLAPFRFIISPVSN